MERGRNSYIRTPVGLALIYNNNIKYLQNIRIKASPHLRAYKRTKSQIFEYMYMISIMPMPLLPNNVFK